jgi:hypothetical protein
MRPSVADPRDTTEHLGDTRLEIFVDYDTARIDLISTRVEGEGENRHTRRFVLSFTPIDARRVSKGLEAALVELVLHGMDKATQVEGGKTTVKES